MSDTTKPKPGSDEAILAGCECPVLENNFGRGRGGFGRMVFTYIPGCPVHFDESVRLREQKSPKKRKGKLSSLYRDENDRRI